MAFCSHCALSVLDEYKMCHSYIYTLSIHGFNHINENNYFTPLSLGSLARFLSACKCRCFGLEQGCNNVVVFFDMFMFAEQK